MNKFMPYEKLSKKEKKKVNAKARKSWNGVNPVTKTTPNPKAYNRAKAKQSFKNDSD